MRFGKYEITNTTVINALGVVVILALVIELGKTITYNYQLDKQVSQLSGQISLLQAQKDELSYQIKYFGTASYQERQARSQLNLQAPGESVVVLPSASPTPAPVASDATKAASKSNFSQWISFLGGHS